jgi:hypothetical protein
MDSVRAGGRRCVEVPVTPKQDPAAWTSCLRHRPHAVVADGEVGRVKNTKKQSVRRSFDLADLRCRKS